MKANAFINKLKEIANLPTIYYSVAGGDWAKWNGTKWNFDCVILVKAILWGWNGNKNHPHGGAIYGSNGVYDDGANEIINRCKNVSNDFKNISVGELLWMQGHVGVYIGNGQVIECTAAWDKKVQYSSIGSNGERSRNGIRKGSWLKHGKLPYIEYEEPSNPSGILHNNNVLEWQKVMNRVYGCGLAVDGWFGPDSQSKANKYQLHYRMPTMKNEYVRFVQQRLRDKGYTLDADSSFGLLTNLKVKQFQGDHGLKIDGWVGKNTIKELLK